MPERVSKFPGAAMSKTRHGKPVSLTLGSAVVLSAMLLTAFLAVRHQRFNDDSALGRDAQRRRNWARHGLALTDRQLPDEHKAHRKCQNNEPPYPVREE